MSTLIRFHLASFSVTPKMLSVLVWALPFLYRFHEDDSTYAFSFGSHIFESVQFHIDAVSPKTLSVLVWPKPTSYHLIREKLKFNKKKKPAAGELRVFNPVHLKGSQTKVKICYAACFDRMCCTDFRRPELLLLNCGRKLIYSFPYLSIFIFFFFVPPRRPDIGY